MLNWPSILPNYIKDYVVSEFQFTFKMADEKRKGSANEVGNENITLKI